MVSRDDCGTNGGISVYTVATATVADNADIVVGSSVA